MIPVHPDTPRNRWARLLAALGVLAALLGAGPPEVLEVRVPASKVTAYFPPGTPLRLMSEAEYRDLLGRARKGSRALDADASPNLVRARHEVRWDGGRLLGRSEFTICYEGPVPSVRPLEPWSPAVLSESRESAVRTLADGRTALWIEETGETKDILRWSVAARSGSRDRVFDLSLPTVSVSRLVLDLPRGLKPEIAHAAFESSHPSPDEPDRVIWSFDGAGGDLALQLRPSGRDRSGPSAVSAWIGGPTRIEVLDASASFEADWIANLAPGGPRTLGFELDPGLKFVSLEGPDVVSVRSEPDGEATRLFVDLAESVGKSTRLRLHALGQVPDEGAWRVPSARPLGSAWTGGRSVVWIGPSRVVKDQTPLHGWPVPASPSEQDLKARGGQLLAYESLAPRSVAEIELGSPSANGSVSIRGRVDLNPEAPSLEATLTWTLDHGPLLALPIDLPDGWTPGSVQVLGLDEPTAWRLERRSGSDQRVIVQPPPYLDPEAPVSVHLVAEADALVAQTLRVPRVRPGFGRLSDDLWLATAPPGSSLTPTRARGLSWIGPDALGDPSEDAETDSPRLSWRWTDPDGILELRRRNDPGAVSGECWTHVQVHGNQTNLDWYVWIRAERAGVSSIELSSPLPFDDLPEWFVLGDQTGLPRDLSPVTGTTGQTEQDSKSGETAFRIALPRGLAPGRPLMLHARLPARPSSDVRVPLVSLRRIAHARGCVLVSVEDPLLVSMGAERLVPTDRSKARSAFEAHFGPWTGPADPDQPSALRPAQAFDYGPEGGTLDLVCSRMDLVESDSYLSEMVLSTVSEGSSRRLRRLLVRLPAGRNRTLDVRMPPGAELGRASLDSRPVVPREQDGQLRFDLSPGPADAPQHELVLDYHEPVPSDRKPGQAETIRWPRFSRPCLSTSIILDRPPSDEVFPADGPFTRTDPEPPGAGSLADLRIWQRPSAPEPEAGTLSNLGERDQAVGPWTMTLDERLVQLDREETPLVVDRQALEDAGIGPRSRPRSTRLAARPLEGFRDLGLVIVPLGRLLLVTTPEARPDRPGGPLGRTGARQAWRTALEDAAARGSDAADRFESVTRWRGALTPDARPLERPETRRRRWSKIGPPPRRFLYETESRPARTARTLGLTAAVLAVGLWLRGGSWRLRLLLLAPTLVAGLLGLFFQNAPQAGWPSGLLLGALASLAFWTGQGLRPVPRPRPESSSSTAPRPSSPSSRTVAPGAASAVLLALALPASSLLAFAQEQPAEGPILVLVPYDETPDPASSGTRFVLRLTDFERLQELASHSAESEPALPVSATSVEHVVELVGENYAMLTSRYHLVVPGSGPAVWAVPLGLGRDLSATLDGSPVPVHVEAQGQSALVAVEGRGAHDLVFSRRIELVSRDTLQAPVLPSSLASLEVKGRLPGRRVEVNRAVGPVEANSGRTFAHLGSSPTVQLHWVEEDRGPEGRLGTVDGLVLWTVEPAGDQVEARLSFRSPEPRAEVRLALGPGLEVRSASFPGWEDASWEGTPEHPIWAAPATPPLPDGSVVVIELWRPSPTSKPGERPSRPAPRIDVLDVEASSGILAVELEPGWSARFEPRLGHDPILEDVFLRSWSTDGQTQPDVETALTWEPRPELEVQAGPTLPRISVRPSVRLEIERGRVLFQAELACQGAQAPLSEVEVLISPGLQVVSVEAEHLSGWTRPARDRLRLRFDALDDADRLIRVSGWLAVPCDPLASDHRLRELPLPGISVAAASSEAGSLVVQAPPGVHPTVKDSSGLTESPGTSALAGITDRLVFRTSGPTPSGRLVWNDEGPRASVGLLSHLLFRPGRVDWTCLVRYRSLGGPTRSIRMTLPEAWGTSLEVETLQGNADAQISTDGPRTNLDLTFDTPIWGEQSLVIRAHRPFQGERVVFPDLVPLGNGQVKTSVAWTNLTGWPLVAEGSAGIQPVDPSRFPTAALPVPSGPDLRVYQVLRGGWGLAIQAPSGHVASSDNLDSRTVSFEDVDCVLSSGGWITGRCRFLVEPGPSPFLSLSLPAGVRPLSALVDGASVRPLKAPDGRLLVPLGETAFPVVMLLWDRTSEPEQKNSLPIPTPSSGQTPLALTAYSPTGSVLAPPSSLRPEIGLAVEVDRYEHACTRLVQGLSHFDRSSVRDRSRLLASLVALELRVRSALRLGRVPISGESWPRELQRALLDRLSQARAGVQDTLRVAGLEDYLAAARGRVGLEPADPESDRSEAAEPASEFRLLRLGHPSWFRGSVDAREGDLTLNVQRAETHPLGDDPNVLLAGIGLLLFCSLLTWLSTPGRPWRLLTVALLALATTVPLDLNLYAYGALLAFVALGAVVRPLRTAPLGAA